MDSSVSPKDEIWFLRVCHHISNAVYSRVRWGSSANSKKHHTSRMSNLGTKILKNLPLFTPRSRRGIKVQLHSFLTSALDGVGWLTSCPGPLYPRIRTPVSTEQASQLVWACVKKKIPCAYRNPNSGPALVLAAMPTEPSRLYASEVADRLFRTHSAAGRHLARSCSANGHRQRLSLLQRCGEVYDVTAQVRYSQHAGHGWCAPPPPSVTPAQPPTPPPPPPHHQNVSKPSTLCQNGRESC